MSLARHRRRRFPHPRQVRAFHVKGNHLAHSVPSLLRKSGKPGSRRPLVQCRHPKVLLDLIAHLILLNMAADNQHPDRLCHCRNCAKVSFCLYLNFSELFFAGVTTMLNIGEAYCQPFKYYLAHYCPNVNRIKSAGCWELPLNLAHLNL